MTRGELSVLALLAGVAGLSYELLYARLLAQYLGEVFYVRSAVLTMVLAGIGVGAALTPRVRGKLGLVQCGLGVYALVLAGIHSVAFEAIVAHAVPLAAASAATTFAVALVVLAPPALAIGLSVPLFAERLAADNGYAQAYGLYNLGAAASLLAVEYLVFRRWGFTATLALVGTIDIIVGLRLLGAAAAPPRTAATPPRSVVIVVCAGFLASLYQLFALKQAQVFWGPFSEIFALHLFVVIAAIGLVSIALARRRASFDAWLTALAVAFPVTLLAPTLLIPLYPSAVDGVVGLSRVLLMLTFFIAMFGPPFVLIGGVLPTFWAGRSGWRALPAGSLGNAAGFIAFVFVVHPNVGDRALAVGIGVGFGVLAVVHTRQIPVALAAAAASVTLFFGFEPDLMQLSFRDLYTPQTYAAAMRSGDEVQSVRAYDSTLVYRETPAGDATATVDGHRTLRVTRATGNPAEHLHGTLPLAYVRSRGHALSLGLGTGISTAALATAFDRVTAVEISPAVVLALPLFRAHNSAIEAQANVEVELADGMTYLHRVPQRYDLILSTVDGPFYRSSAKLYSAEFFALARARLRPGGVLAFWLDRAYAPEVNAMILATARVVFPTCHVALLKPGYAQVVCGVALAWRGDAADADLFFDRVRAPWATINTLDRPHLEFARTLHVRSDRTLPEALGLDFASRPDGPVDPRARCRRLVQRFGPMPACAPLQRQRP